MVASNLRRLPVGEKMLEVIAFVAFAMALAAFLGGRKTAERLENEINSLKAEIARLSERQTAPESAPSQAAEEAQATEAIASEDEGKEGPWSRAAREGARIFGGETAEREKVEEAGQDEQVAAAVTVEPAATESLESRIGGQWPVWVGGLALALGGYFLVQYSIDAGLLSPAVRLALAAAFGLVLGIAGEVIRRRAVPTIADRFRHAMIPGVLTAAGAVTLFGVVYAAHGIYGFIGTATAFALLALVSLVTVALSLLHGQALAGLGLLASLLTPLFVSSAEPRPWVLFGFLSIAWLATLCASRLRRWTVVPTLANVGLGLWGLAYVVGVTPFEAPPVTFALLVMIAGVGLVWPGAAERAAEDGPGTGRAAATAAGRWERLFAPPHAAVTVSAAIAATVLALLLISPAVTAARFPVQEFVALIAALALVGALRATAIYPALFATFGAIAGTWSLTALSNVLAYLDPSRAQPEIVVSGGTAMLTAMVLSAVFVLLASFVLARRLETRSQFAVLWAGIAAIAPNALLAMSFLMTGKFAFDLPHGLAAFVSGLLLLALVEWLYRRSADTRDLHIAGGLSVAGSFGLFVLGLHAWTDGLVTTLAIALLGAGDTFAARARSWPVLPWITVGSALVVLARIGWEPTIVGAGKLSTTPVFNALLPGYGIPALLLVASAYLLRASPSARVRNLLQALASLFVLLTLAILVRHAMNGGVLDSSVPTLAEQSIYTLIAIGASGIFMTLDTRSPSPVFRYGGMGLGVLSMLSVLSAHLFSLNPYFSGELLGSIPFFDLLFIGYLLPGIAYAGLSWYARDKRPWPYVAALAVGGAVLAFAWASLSVRRFWQGENVADWRGFLQGETYTYSVVWLVLGVLLLVAGSRFNAKSIRIASAALVFIAVLKVFLIDMSNLEGFLRALSFIGLGGVLIGIGLFYQKILSNTGSGGPAGAAATAAEAGERTSRA
ncbi:putative membrane protein [Sinorhizobium terangae]|nr:putative membrane protein [Sinorhizobium terangae]